eukprot:5165277-Pleurochrysis_carterae.AAC.1
MVLCVGPLSADIAGITCIAAAITAASVSCMLRLLPVRPCEVYAGCSERGGTFAPPKLRTKCARIQPHASSI